jgi:hypothetical protein
MNTELVDDLPTECYGPEELQQGSKDLVWEFRDRQENRIRRACKSQTFPTGSRPGEMESS